MKIEKLNLAVLQVYKCRSIMCESIHMYAYQKNSWGLGLRIPMGPQQGWKPGY